MATRDPSQRELVFCHSCSNEWYRDEHGLVCPDCQSDVVEIIEHDHDPRAELMYDQQDDDEAAAAEALGDHYPWQHHHDAPDPDEGDIDHVQFSGPGMRFSSTTYVSGPDGFRTHHTTASNPRAADLFPQLLNMFNPALQRPPAAGPPPAPPHHPEGGDSTLREGPFRVGGLHGNIRVTTSGFGSPRATQEVQSDDLLGIFNSILTGIGGGGGPLNSNPTHGGRGGAPHPLGFLANMLDPANARSGDAVYTNEALDRIISQLMEQHSGSSAPGPASEGAIGALPRITLTKEHLGEDGRAECSICMDACDLGAEVVELPCSHWFHSECVAMWLREHDTCPQCRRGIMPKDGDQNAPRQTGQAPRFWQMPAQGDGPVSPGTSGATAAAAGQAEGSDRPRGGSGSGHGASGLTGSIAGWMGRLRPRSSRSGASGDGHGGEPPT